MWVGCADHDLATLLKSAVGVLSSGLISIYSALHGCLSKNSMHKNRDFERLEKWLGLEIKKNPQFLEVRFRVIEMCQLDGLYSYFADLKTKVMETSYQCKVLTSVVEDGRHTGNTRLTWRRGNRRRRKIKSLRN